MTLDFDPRYAIFNLSNYIKTYWFCFEAIFTNKDLQEKYYGFLYKVKTLEDIVNGLVRINERRFESLAFIDDKNILKKKLR